MTARFAQGFGAAAILVLTTQTAHAELTANDVWSDWKDYLGSTGYTVTGDEARSKGDLTVSEVEIRMVGPEGLSSFEITMDSLVFSENGDGTVSVTMPERIPMAFVAEDDEDGLVSGVLTYAHTDTGMIASGSPDDVTYTYSTARAQMELGSLVADGEQVPGEAMKFLLTTEDVDATTRLLKGELRNYSQQMTIGSVSYDITFDDPDSEDRGSLTGRMSDVVLEGTGVLPLDMDPADFDATLQAGFAAEGSMLYGAGNGNVEGVGNGESFAFASSSQGGTLGFRMDASSIAYEVEQKQSSISLASAELPVPIEIASAVTAFNLTVPVRKSDEQQDFSLGLNLTDFTMSEVLWSIFDPTSILPRDPATVVLDAAGKATMLVNLLDPDEAAMVEMTGAPPAELNELTVNKLLLSLVGASISGSGHFTFDNSDLSTFEGFPRPVGHADLQLTGINALLDKMVAMGLVGDQEVMAARAMIAAFAMPGAAPDTLNSRIELTEQGQILANGMRIK
jgi:hypothetical protein